MGHCFSIITQYSTILILNNTNATLPTAEEAYIKAAIAQWDATIICWRSKFKYNQIRPVTYIQQNIDNTWLPFLTTPPHPEYPVAHAMITSSIMEAISSQKCAIMEKSFWMFFLSKEKKQKHMLIELFKRPNEQMKALVGKDYAQGTYQIFNRTLNHTIDFLNYYSKVSDIDINKPDYDFIAEYEFCFKKC